MFQTLAIAFALPFLLLCLDAVGFLPLPGFVETVLYLVAGASIFAGVAKFGSRFLTHIFGR